VREHHRKIRKVEKIKAKKGGLTLNAMKKKDPGIPSMWPFKEELLKEVDEYKDTVFHPPLLPHPICFHLFRYGSNPAVLWSAALNTPVELGAGHDFQPPTYNRFSLRLFVVCCLFIASFSFPSSSSGVLTDYSQDDMMGVWYRSFNFGANISPVAPTW